jgi:hypothetical protein
VVQSGGPVTEPFVLIKAQGAAGAAGRLSQGAVGVLMRCTSVLSAPSARWPALSGTGQRRLRRFL